MTHVPTDLGNRILMATRMAVMAHWQGKLEDETAIAFRAALRAGFKPVRRSITPRQETNNAEMASKQNHSGQCDRVGGTAGSLVTEDRLPLATDGGARDSSRRPSQRQTNDVQARAGQGVQWTGVVSGNSRLTTRPLFPLMSHRLFRLIFRRSGTPRS